MMLFFPRFSGGRRQRCPKEPNSRPLFVRLLIFFGSALGLPSGLRCRSHMNLADKARQV